jgi:hypothetical protein
MNTYLPNNNFVYPGYQYKVRSNSILLIYTQRNTPEITFIIAEWMRNKQIQVSFLNVLISGEQRQYFNWIYRKKYFTLTKIYIPHSSSDQPQINQATMLIRTPIYHLAIIQQRKSLQPHAIGKPANPRRHLPLNKCLWLTQLLHLPPTASPKHAGQQLAQLSLLRSPQNLVQMSHLRPPAVILYSYIAAWEFFLADSTTSPTASPITRDQIRHLAKLSLPGRPPDSCYRWVPISGERR